MAGRASVAGVAVDATSATAVVLTGGDVEEVHTVAAATPGAAVSTVLRRLRVSDPTALVTVADPAAALPVAMSPDMLNRNRFVTVAAARLDAAAAAGALTMPQPAMLTGVLGRPEVVRAGRLSTALAVAVPPPDRGRLGRWVAGTGSGRKVTAVCPPVVAAQCPAGVTVWLFASTLAVSARLGLQPLGWRTVRAFGWSAAADRIGPDGMVRLRAAWAGGRGDPVGQFEARRVADAAVAEAMRLRSGLAVAGFAVGGPLSLLSGWGPSPLLAAAADVAGVAVTAAVPGDEQADPVTVAAAGAAAARTRFGGSVVVAEVSA